MVNNFDNTNGICVNTKDDVLRERFIFGAELSDQMLKLTPEQLYKLINTAEELEPALEIL